MKPTAVIYSSRFSLRWSVPYALAGVTLLSGGALLGNYLGEKAAAARSLDVAEWSSPRASVATVVRKSSLLRGSFGEFMVTAKLSDEPKDQERIAPARTIISVPGKNGRHKNDYLASLVPMTPEVGELLGKSSNTSPAATSKLSDRLGTDEDAGVSFDLPDRPMPSASLSLPGEIVGLQDNIVGLQDNDAVISPASYPTNYEGVTQQLSARTQSPSIVKLASMAARGSKERVRQVTRRKHAVAEQVCLAKAIYFEARSEPTLGQMAVAGVVMNRVRSKRYPNSICGVVFQNEQKRDACQFSFACDGKAEVASNKKLWRRSMQLAKSFATGRKKAVGIRNALHYHADYVNPKWASKMRVVKKIGRHIFYLSSTRVASK